MFMWEIMINGKG